MESMEPSKQASFCDRFCTAANEISEELSASRAATTNGNLRKWSKFCLYMALYPLHVSYGYPVPILNTFAGQYQTVSLAPSGR